jgi:hypothetical protein
VVRRADSGVSTVATCNVLQSNLPVQTLEGSQKPKGRKETFMRLALGIAFGMIAVAPFFGRWRANVWLRKHIPAERTMKTVPEIA